MTLRDVGNHYQDDSVDAQGRIQEKIKAMTQILQVTVLDYYNTHNVSPIFNCTTTLPILQKEAFNYYVSCLNQHSSIKAVQSTPDE